MGGSPGDVSENPVTQEKRKKGWRMNCGVGKATEGLENDLWRSWSDRKVGEWAELSTIQLAELIVTSPTSQLIFQHFRRFPYVTVHSPSLPLLLLCHSSFSNPSVASPTSQLILQPFRCFTYFIWARWLTYFLFRKSPRIVIAHGGESIFLLPVTWNTLPTV